MTQSFRFLLLLSLCGTALPAFAQLDSLLAPVPMTATASAPQTALASAAIPAAMTSAAPAAAANAWLDPVPAGPSARLSTKTSLEGADLLAEVQRQLSNQMNLEGELKLELTRPWPAMKLPAPLWQLVISELPAGGLASSFYVRVQITSAGQTLAEGQLPLRAQLWQDVWVSSGRLERGVTVDRALVAPQKLDVLRAGLPFIPASVDPESLETLQSLPAGRPLTRRDVVARPIIRKGQVVEVVGKNGLLNVRLKAMALENGATGDLIKCRNLESRRDINAQILNPNEVQIHF